MTAVIKTILQDKLWLFYRKNSAITIMCDCSSLDETEKEDGKTISPDYASKAKADAFAEGWMQKHPNGAE